MQALSVKKLRGNFPLVRSELTKGETFLIIYNNMPIAKLTPVECSSDLKDADDKDIQNASISDLGNDFLSLKELKYYLSLK